ncbi:MAG: hypothetical protein ABGY42_00795 [bacterium]
MNEFIAANIAPHYWGILFSLACIAWGFVVGGLMGALDTGFKGRMRKRALKNLNAAYGGDEAKLDKFVAKGFKYCIRSHIHGGAIGSSALACILLLALTGENGALGVFSSFAFGAGGLAYSIYWMLAGIHTADIGDATLAKHHMRFVAIPGAGLAMLGLFGTLFLFAF